MNGTSLWGEQTGKAMANFGSSQTPRRFIRAFAETKMACLSAIQECGAGWPETDFSAINGALESVRSGEHDNQFCLSFWQGGAGTSLNQNMNEVVATLAGKLAGREFHPIEDINRFQSTNDTVPTAMTVVLYRGLERIEQAVIALQEALVVHEQGGRTTLLAGRTELQDALPMTLGQVFSSWLGMIERDRWRISKLRDRIRNVPLGGTAVGTSFGAPSAYVFAAERHLRRLTELPLCRSQNLSDAVAHQDAWVELGNGYQLVATNLAKLAGDLLLYSSSAVREMRHPAVQDGSTQMAAKTNPVFLELVRGLAVEVAGEAPKLAQYASQGQWQLNPMVPFMFGCLLRQEDALLLALETMSTKLLPQMEVCRENMLENLADSPALLNALVPELGYEAVKKLAVTLRCRAGNGKSTQPRTRWEELVELLARETGRDESWWRERLSVARLTGFSPEKQS